MVAIIAFFVVTIGKSINASTKLTNINTRRALAQSYAQESIEIINSIKHDLFACTCLEDSCSGNICYAVDGQSCQRFEAYTSCWTEYPSGFSGENNFYLDSSGGTWHLQPLGAGVETISASSTFSRKITIENVNRGADGNIAETGTPDYNTKKITVTVWYDYHGATYSFSLKTIVTAWKNYE